MSPRVIERETRDKGVSSEFEESGTVPDTFYAKHGKRAMDIVGASIGLLILSPLFAAVAGCIGLTSRGPVFFRQVRMGKNQRTFRIVKFRSMVDGRVKQGSAITIAGDQRVTTIGRFLRRYKIDELPQLWNVLRGEMSLVGPRPELPEYVDLYTPQQRAVLHVRPGITDPASLVYRNEEDLLAAHTDPEQFYRTQILPDKLARNIAYLKSMSLTHDLRLIFKTVASAFLFTNKL
jgi:lipopolysaccharide/colanic/teichoic acid biosynthesis glycosyltransferase